MNSVPLCSFLRQGYPEIQVFGDICISDGSQTLFQSSELKNRFPMRSLLKPFQFIATGLAQEKTASPWHKAALGSVSASEEQVKILQEWVESSFSSNARPRTQLKAYPLDEKFRVLVKNQDQSPEEIYHTCFSKHLAILEACKKWGWSEKNYLNEEHPYHERVKELLGRLLGDRRKSLEWVTDGCGLPTPVLGLDEMAKLFQILAQGNSMPELKWIRDWMVNNPDWIGGTGRIDTQLMKENPNTLIAKEGADGLLGVGVLPNAQFPKGLGIILKMASGYDPQKSLIALKPVLDTLSINYSLPTFPGQEISYHYSLWQPVKNQIIDMSPQVSPRLAVWPGDTPFKLEFLQHVNKGNHLSLSKLETTVHLGSHTDSPVHFGKNLRGIESVDLHRYLGACQVIAVEKAPHTEIVPRDLDGIEILAPRVLFKTGSCPDPSIFNRDFNSLSSDLIEFLAEKGVVLVGIDTPSIDLFESQELPAHHATLKSQMAILEGIVLENVSAGLYQLIALPLKLENADASPVRAVLVK